MSEEDRVAIQWALDEVRRETASECPFRRGEDQDCLTPLLALTRGLDAQGTIADAVELLRGGREARVRLADGSGLLIRIVRRWFRAPVLEVSREMPKRLRARAERLREPADGEGAQDPVSRPGNRPVGIRTGR